MAIGEKLRLLSNFMPIGFRTIEVDGRSYAPIGTLPYELEELFVRWISLRPELIEKDSPDCAFIEWEKGMAVSAEGWGEFVSWTTTVLKAEMERLERCDYERGLE